MLGQFWFWGGLSDSLTALRAKSWPTAEGEIRTAKVMEMRSRRGRVSYKPALRYSFVVKEKRFTGELLDFGDGGAGSMENVAKILRRYQPYQEVTVHYDPKDPEIAVLETGMKGSHYFRLIFGAALSALGGWLGYARFRAFQDAPISPQSGF